MVISVCSLCRDVCLYLILRSSEVSSATMYAARAVTSLRCLTKPSLARQLPQLSFATLAVRQSSGDHVKMWSAERFVSLAQVPACILPFIVTTPLTDAMFCTLAILHSH